MKLSHFALCLIDAWGGVVKGRTLLQKLAYFVGHFTDMEDELAFVPYYYGPFSPELEGAIGKLQAFGFLEERTAAFGAVSPGGFEVRRYDYTLTEDGHAVVRMIQDSDPEMYERIRTVVGQMKEAGASDYMELALAAKTYLILNRHNRPVTTDEVRDTARQLKWQLTPESVDRAVQFLEKLDLAQRTARA